jgi:CheY-like chemotaxis protein
LREARLAARLNHPNIATIFAVEEHDSTLYLVMELVEGESLSDAIARGPIAEAAAIDVVLQVAHAIAEAHARGIIHRDIKPENIMLSPRGVKVLDFGIAREIFPGDARMTQAGTIIGTPHYMSPEQAQGFALHATTDIFSLGAVFYEMLSGAKPFDGESAMEVLVNVISKPHAPVAKVTRDLAAIIDRCLEKRPAARFQSAVDLASALSSVSRGAAAHPTLILAPAPTPAPKAAPAGRALVADDDPMTRRVLRTALEKMGYEVDEAVDGSDAIRHLKANDYVALITDLLMPRLDGWSVLDFMRASPARRPSRVVVTSTLGDVKLGEVDREMVNAILPKPIAMARLSEALAT